MGKQMRGDWVWEWYIWSMVDIACASHAWRGGITMGQG
jgi:hypothetical protein